MFGSKKRQFEAKLKHAAERRRAFEQDEKRAARLYERAHKLKECDQASLPVLALALYRDAHHEVQLIRQSIRDRTSYQPYQSDGKSIGDVATFMGEDLADMVREGVTNPQTIFEAMSEQFPKVHFTVDFWDAAAIIAATIREERLLGIVEGLELAGYKFPKWR